MNKFIPLHYKKQVMIRFETKEESKKRQEEEALKRTPDERFHFFLRLVAELSKFQSGHKEEKNNFILVRKK